MRLGWYYNESLNLAGVSIVSTKKLFMEQKMDCEWVDVWGEMGFMKHLLCVLTSLGSLEPNLFCVFAFQFSSVYVLKPRSWHIEFHGSYKQTLWCVGVVVLVCMKAHDAVHVQQACGVDLRGVMVVADDTGHVLVVSKTNCTSFKRYVQVL